MSDTKVLIAIQILDPSTNGFLTPNSISDCNQQAEQDRFINLKYTFITRKLLKSSTRRYI